MASYEDDHNIRPSTSTPAQTRRPRLDLTEFFERRTHAPSSTDEFRALAHAYAAPELDSALATSMVEALMGAAGAGDKAEGVPEGWTDTLERVPKAKLGEGVCAICNERFLDDKYPLVVRLPCHRDHMFDLECIAPWLQLKSTCPLDRKELVTQKPPPPPPPADEEEEEEFDDMYG